MTGAAGEEAAFAIIRKPISNKLMAYLVFICCFIGRISKVRTFLCSCPTTYRFGWSSLSVITIEDNLRNRTVCQAMLKDPVI